MYSNITFNLTCGRENGQSELIMSDYRKAFKPRKRFKTWKKLH